MYCEDCGKKTNSNGICEACNESPNNHEFSELLLDKDEEYVFSIKNGLIPNAILEHSLKSDFIVLTNRHIYYSGKGIVRNGNRIDSAVGTSILPIKHISSYGFSKVSNLKRLILAIVVIFIGLGIGLVLGEITYGISMTAILPGIIILISYFTSIKNIFFISTGSLTIELNYTLFGLEKFKQFTNKLSNII